MSTAIPRPQLLYGPKKISAHVMAFVQHHAAETKIVVDRRAQPASARFERRLSSPCAVGHIVKHIQRVRLMIEEVEPRQALDFCGRHLECCSTYPDNTRCIR